MRPTPSAAARRRSTRLATAAGSLLLTTALLAGCSSGDGEATGTTTTVSSAPVATQAPTTTTTVAPSTPVTTAPRSGMTADEIAVRNVIDQYYAELALAADPPDPARPQLVSLLSGSFLQSVRQLLQGAQANGQRAVRPGGGPIRHRTESVELSADGSALAVECVIDDMVLYDRTGAVASDKVTTYFTNTTLRRGADGRWVIDRSQKQPGGGQCPGL